MATDHYADGTCRWWHLSQPPPELVAALGDGWLPRGGRVPGGKLLLRASLRTAGVRNDIDEAVIAGTFGGWRVERMERAEVPSDTRMLEVLVARRRIMSNTNVERRRYPGR
ncbi:MAG: hypothetical protein ABSB59_35335 [Streptosporangiaceae bacterium]|jgi:hypothetical protein